MGKKAVLIGINYPGTKAELKGCINDVRRMHKCLIDRYGFSEDDIKILIDTDEAFTKPTGANIRQAIDRLVSAAEPGDYLFIHYSGHGTRLPAETGEEDDTGYDECIVPCDMNLITDDDFKDFIMKVPDGCKLTMVSDSCHSGGLMESVKEQIGESTQSNADEGSDSGFSLSGFLKSKVKHKLESRGINLHHLHRDRDRDRDRDHDNQEESPDRDVSFRSRSLPLNTLIDILKQNTGKDDIDVGKIRPTLFDVFGNDASPKVKKFMHHIMQKLQNPEAMSHGIISFVGGLAMDYLKMKLEGNNSYGAEAIETQVTSSQEVYAGNTGKCLPENGILVSGCQSDQTSADATPKGRPDEAYGALSNAIQGILGEVGDREVVSNRELVMTARKRLKREGFKQRPGLYCSDEFVDAPFIC